MEKKGKILFPKILFWKIFKKPTEINSEILDFPSFQQQKKTFLGVSIVFVGWLLASIVQLWIGDVQNCSSLNQLRPELSKVKSAGTALDIAENANFWDSDEKDWISKRELNPLL